MQIYQPSGSDIKYSEFYFVSSAAFDLHEPATPLRKYADHGGSFNGQVCKGLKQADCKSVPSQVRRFESYLAHHYFMYGFLRKFALGLIRR